MQNREKQDERELSFKAIDPSRARTLTREQCAFYNKQGYYHPLTAYSGEEVTKNRAYVDHLFELIKADRNTDSYALLAYHTRCAGLYDMVMNDRILDVIEDVIGPDIICWTSQMFCKVAHDSKSVPFHQDASYWPLTPSRTVNVWLAIDDSDRENSCLQVVPGTHCKGYLKWSTYEGEVVDEINQKIDDIESYGEPANIELRAGQFSIFADMLAHGSQVNRSDRRRCGFVMRYCPPSVKPLNSSFGRNAILCRGRDTTGYWTYHPRPSGDDVSSWMEYLARQAKLI